MGRSQKAIGEEEVSEKRENKKYRLLDGTYYVCQLDLTGLIVG